MSKVCVIVNPNSAKGKGAKCIGKIERAFEKAGIRAEILITGKAGDAEAMSLQACLSGFGTVVAAGGDGCVNEVVNGIMKSGRKVSMGIIPTGRGNDFAWVAGIPREIEKAVTLIACGTARLIDTGYLEGGVFKDGHYFLNGTGFGFEPAINFTAASYRHLNGMVSYIMAFFHCLIHIPAPYELELEVDGKKQNLCSQQISVCNGRRMGSAFILAPNAILDDGLLDIVYATRPVTRRQLLPMVISFFRGTQLEKCSFMSQLRGRSVRITSRRRDLIIHTDGEFVSRDEEKCLVRIIPSSLSLFYGRAKV